jgi:hypothetical protein
MRPKPPARVQGERHIAASANVAKHQEKPRHRYYEVRYCPHQFRPSPNQFGPRQPRPLVCGARPIAAAGLGFHGLIRERPFHAASIGTFGNRNNAPVGRCSFPTVEFWLHGLIRGCPCHARRLAAATNSRNAPPKDRDKKAEKRLINKALPKAPSSWRAFS